MSGGKSCQKTAKFLCSYLFLQLVRCHNLYAAVNYDQNVPIPLIQGSRITTMPLFVIESSNKSSMTTFFKLLDVGVKSNA